MLTTVEPDNPGGPDQPGPHGLLVADTDSDRRIRAAAWVSRALSAGDKVYYKGWLDDGIPLDHHWIFGPGGVPGAPEALTSGQLEFLDFPTVVERCGGTTDGLLELLTDEVERALHDGWPAVAMSQESTRRPMADAAEIAQFAAQERGYDRLADRWPLRTLCQLTIEEENDAAVRESAAVHYREIVDVSWSTRMLDGRWHLRGHLDAHVLRRFGGAVSGALQDARQSWWGPDLHVDLSAVDFMDVSCVQRLMLAARSAARYQDVVLYRPSSFIRHLIDVVGRPRTVLIDEAGPEEGR